MAKASKVRPWSVEIKPHGLPNWYHMDAYRDEDTARANQALMQKRAPEAEFRIVRIEQ